MDALSLRTQADEPFRTPGSTGKSLMSGSVLPQSSRSVQAQLCDSVCFCILGALSMEARASSRPGTLFLSHTFSPVLFLSSFLFAFPLKVEMSGLEPCARGPSKGKIQIRERHGRVDGRKWRSDGSPRNLTSE